MELQLKKEYLTIYEKNEICNSIVETALEEQNGMLIENLMDKIIAIDLAILQFYFNVDVEDVDKVYQDNTISEARKQIPFSELNLIEELVDHKIQEKKSIYNSLAGVLNRVLTNLIEKIPDQKGLQKILKNAGKELDKINPQALETIKTAIETKGLVK